MRYLICIAILCGMIFSRRAFTDDLELINNSRSCAQRPNLDFNIISPSGNFLIHYNYYYQGIDEYAYEVGISADSSRKVIVDIMGFNAEIPDDDQIYDIYIVELGTGAYGVNCPDSNLISSWVEIDDNFIGFGYNGATGFDAMRITVAHEFFHAVQRSYILLDSYSRYFFELSSVWIEDIIYPDINDYVTFSQLADDYFSNPEKNINQYNGYGIGLYGHYLNYKFGDQIMQSIWNQFSLADLTQNNYVIESINTVLDSSIYNSSFTKTWIDFNARNIYNGLLNDMNNDIYYYKDQSLFNPIETTSNPLENISSSFMINNKSIKIKTFDIEDSYAHLCLINNINYNPEFDNAVIAISSNDGNNILNMMSNQYYSNFLDSDDTMHLLYVTDQDNKEMSISINDEIFSNSKEIILYPNPVVSNGTLNLRLSSGIEVDNLTIDIYSIDGRKVKKLFIGEVNYSFNEYNEFSIKAFDSAFPSGVYILRLNLDNIIYTKKIVYLN